MGSSPSRQVAHRRTAGRGGRDDAAPVVGGRRVTPGRALRALEDALVASGAVEDARTVAQTHAALRSLNAIAPQLHKYPDLLHEAETLLTTARARAEALGTVARSGGSLWMAGATVGDARLAPGAAASLRGLGGLGDTPFEVIDLEDAAARDDGYMSSLRLPGRADGRAKASPTHNTPRGQGTVRTELGGMWAQPRDSSVGVPNAKLLRAYADADPWVQAAVKARKDQVGRARMDVQPLDPSTPLTPAQDAIRAHLAPVIKRPNEYRDSYRSLMERVIDDILVLDRGVVSKGFPLRGKVGARQANYLYSEDGATIRIFPGWSGKADEPRYLYQEDNANTKTPLYNDEIICIMANEASHRFGLGPMQVLLKTVEADMEAMRAAAAIVSGKPPAHLIHVQGAANQQQQLKALAKAYERDIQGRKELFFIGTDGDIKVFPLTMSLSDSQFMEWMLHLARTICAVFQVSPQQLGITFDVNKATAGTQQEIFEDTGLIPLLCLIEEYLNTEFVGDYAPLDDRGLPDLDALNLRVFYPQVSEMERMLHYERVMQTARNGLAPAWPVITPNMALAMLGEEPVAGGNRFWVMTKDGPYPTPLGYDDDFGDFGAFGVTDGGMGALDPDGGPALSDEDDEAAVASGKQKKDEPIPGPPTTAKPAGGKPSAGNGSSGQGDGPNLQEADNETSGTASGKPAAKAARFGTPPPAGVTPAVMVAPRVRYDYRRPGERWTPATDGAAPQASVARSVAQMAGGLDGMARRAYTAPTALLPSAAADDEARHDRQLRPLGRLASGHPARGHHDGEAKRPPSVVRATEAMESRVARIFAEARSARHPGASRH